MISPGSSLGRYLRAGPGGYQVKFLGPTSLLNRRPCRRGGGGRLWSLVFVEYEGAAAWKVPRGTPGVGRLKPGASADRAGGHERQLAALPLAAPGLRAAQVSRATCGRRQLAAPCSRSSVSLLRLLLRGTPPPAPTVANLLDLYSTGYLGARSTSAGDPLPRKYEP